MAWELTSQHICLIGLVQRRVPQVPEMTEVSPLVRRRQWQPTPVLLPGKSHGRRSLVGCSPWGRWGSDMTERLHFHFSLSCIGEGNGNPLQCSCLENPRDGEPGGLPCMRSHRVGHDWSDSAAAENLSSLRAEKNLHWIMTTINL